MRRVFLYVNASCFTMCVRDDASLVVGPLDPEIARVLRPDSLRAKFGFDKVRNAVHCTDLPEDGALETHYFFKILQEA